MKKYYLFLGIFISFFLSAQTPDQMKEIETYLDSAYEKHKFLDLVSSAEFSKKALDRSKEINYNKGIAYSHFYIAQSLFELGNYKESLNYLWLAESEKYTESDDFLKFEIARVRSRVYGSTSHLENAVKEQKRALRFLPDMKRPEADKKFLMTLAYENLALSYHRLEKWDSSFYYLQKNKDILEAMDEKLVFPNLQNLYSLLGNQYSSTGDFKSANSYFLKSIQISDKYKFPYTSFTYTRWGDMELKKEKPDSALYYYLQALESLKVTNFTHEFPSVYSKISASYLKLGNEEKAEEYKLKSLEIDNELKSKQLEASQTVLNQVLDKAKMNQNKNSNRTYLSIAIVLSLLLLFICYLMYTRRKREKMLEQQERMIEKKELHEKVLQQKLNDSFSEIIQLAKKNNPEFYARFQEVYPELIEELLKINAKLRISELTLCAYLYLGFTTKDIAAFTFTSPNTVRNRKYNLKKKLAIDADENMELFLKKLSKE